MIRKTALFLLGALLLAILLEGALRLLPVSSATLVGHYIDPAIKTYPAHHRFTVATGWDLKNAQRHLTNNLGFVDTRDFTPDPQAIAVIGDSFVEANMLPPAQRIGPQLEALLHGPAVYSMGVPGTSLIDYAHRARFAHDKLGIDRLVFVVETGDVRQMLCGSGNHDRDCIDKKTGRVKSIEAQPPGRLKQIARHSALAQYLFSQLRLDPSRWMRKARRRLSTDEATASDNHQQKVDPVSREQANTLVDYFLSTLPTTARPPVLLINTEEAAAGSAEAAWHARDMDLLASKASQAGWIVVHLDAPFADWRERTGLSTSIGPYDGHWNTQGHRIAAQAVADALNARPSAP